MGNDDTANPLVHNGPLIVFRFSDLSTTSKVSFMLHNL